MLGNLPENDPKIEELQSEIQQLKKELPQRKNDRHWMYAAE